MSRLPQPPDLTGWPDSEPPPSWTGAPAYQPSQERPAHAPMPGAPPGPPAFEVSPPPVGRPPGSTGYRAALVAAAVWAAVSIALALVLDGLPPSVADLARVVGAMTVTTVLTALAVRGFTRNRSTTFPTLVAIALPIFIVLRVLSFLL